RGAPVRPTAAHARRTDHLRHDSGATARRHRTDGCRGRLPGAHRTRHRRASRDAPLSAGAGAMNPRRSIATAGRVLQQLRHDPRSIALMLIAPSLLVGLFAWLFADQDGVFDRFGGAILGLFPFIVMFLITS